jgi:endoglucanase
MTPRGLAGAVAAAVLAASAVVADNQVIRVNTIGFLPDQRKAATIAGPTTPWALVRVDDGFVAATNPVAAAKTIDGRAGIFTADFSQVTRPGRYQLRAPGLGSSAPFVIGGDVWREPFAVVQRSFRLMRCGAAVEATVEGRAYRHGACHTNDAWLDRVKGVHTRHPSIGGWHDAGDYNKYVVNAAATAGVLLRAWEDFGPAIRRATGDAEGGAMPAYLAEVQWELAWVLTMQDADGSVWHKLSTLRFGGFIPPEDEDAERFMLPWSSAATADFVALTAAAARIYAPYDGRFAGTCLEAARRSRSFLTGHTADHPADLSGCSTGPYQSSDLDDRLWAAAEFWETTGDAGALDELETRIRGLGARVDADWDWGNMANLGVLRYALSRRDGADALLQARVRTNLVTTADAIVRTAAGHPYGRPLGSSHYWGANGSVARQVVVLAAARRVNPRPEYRDAALDALGHLFGRNPHGRSYVTGLGNMPPQHPHDRRSGKDGPPWPGYLVGGAHPGPDDWRDEQGDFRTNEIAINWNAALAYALAAFLPGADF